MCLRTALAQQGKALEVVLFCGGGGVGGVQLGEVVLEGAEVGEDFGYAEGAGVVD